MNAPRQSWSHADHLPEDGTTLLIEASAGTGKTRAIADLVTRFVVEQGRDIRRIALVTFTNAAAEEMRARVRAKLMECARTPTMAEESRDPLLARLWNVAPGEACQRTERLTHALAHVDAAPILTIHGFCERILSHLGPLADHDATDRLDPHETWLAEQVVADMYATWGQRMVMPFTAQEATAWVKHATYHPSAHLIDESSPATQFVEACRQQMKQRQRRLGILSYDDILSRCHDALMNAPDPLSVKRRLSQAYSIVMVDEFQDTDEVQWAILSAAFQDAATMVLIGDPKQSIYSFRGADLRVYNGASAGSMGGRQTLGTNWRSSPELVRAVTALMAGADPSSGIHVTTVATSENTPCLTHVENTSWAHPLRLRVPDNLTACDTVDAARAIIRRDLVADIGALLAHGASWCPTPEAPPRPLTPGDIAIIVLTNARRDQLVDDLSNAGIPAAALGKTSVFASAAASAWKTLLQACADGSADALTMAALTPLVGYRIDDIVSGGHQVTTHLLATMDGLATVLKQSGPLVALQWLCTHQALAARLVDSDERFWTDARQIAQMLAAVRAASSLAWLTEHMANASDPSDDVGRRLDTDATAVRLMTVHQAKGLQFPIVYLPYLCEHWSPGADARRALVAPDPHGGWSLSLGMAGHDDHVTGALRDLDAQESMRKTYVALTRAMTHITTWWVPSKTATPGSPLAELLWHGQDSSLEHASAWDPRRVATPGMYVETIRGREVPAYRAEDSTLTPRPWMPFTRRFDVWKRTSFSDLTAQAHEAWTGWDEPDISVTDVTELVDLDRLSPMSDFPGGTGFGSLVHAIFEHADPTSPDFPSVVSAQMEESGLTQINADALTEALRLGLSTPLGAITDGACLADIPARDRLAELSFELPLARSNGRTLSDLADLLDTYIPPGHALADYPKALRSEGIPTDPLQGFLTGSIDAVLRRGQRHIVVDYKTNRLAPPHTPLTLGHYTRASMATAMIDSHYPLQALLYCVALHRFLRWRIPSYDPAAHLGGVAYLFVRGMAGPNTAVIDSNVCGVFTWDVPPALVEASSDLLSGVS